MRQTSIESMRTGRILALAVILLAASAGCATRKDALLPHGSETMSDLWSQYSGPADSRFAGGRLVKTRQTLRRPLNGQEAKSALSQNISYTRTAASGIDREFKRLPNPDLIMYVFPHLAGRNPVPIPGYSTVFPFYSEVHYAMPGDRQAEY